MRGALLLVLVGAAQAGSISRQVDPFIGTEGTGHVVPGATTPFGMVFPSPDNADRGWSYSGGYQHRNPRILGFSNTHQSGTGIPELGDVLLQPSRAGRWSAQTQDFSARKSAEQARPGHYAVSLKELGVHVELTATPKVALQRYRFSRPGRVQLLVDLQHGLQFTEQPRVTAAQVQLGAQGLQGTVHSRNWWSARPRSRCASARPSPRSRPWRRGRATWRRACCSTSTSARAVCWRFGWRCPPSMRPARWPIWRAASA